MTVMTGCCLLTAVRGGQPAPTARSSPAGGPVWFRHHTDGAVLVHGSLAAGRHGSPSCPAVPPDEHHGFDNGKRCYPLRFDRVFMGRLLFSMDYFQGDFERGAEESCSHSGGTGDGCPLHGAGRA